RIGASGHSAVFFRLLQIAPIVVGADRRGERGRERAFVFGGGAPGVFPVGLWRFGGAGGEALLKLYVLVAAIMQRQRQAVRAAQLERQFGRSAPRLILVIGIERPAFGLTGLRGIVERAQQVVEGIAVS